MHVTFPHQLIAQGARFALIGQTRIAQESISGASTVIASLAARWSASVTFVIRDEAGHLAFRAFMAGLEGMLGTTDVPAFARYRPLDQNGRAVTRCTVASLAEAQTMEHFGFENAEIEGAQLAADAALRATDLQVTESATTGIRPGHRFSIGDRLHEVQLAWTDGARRLRVQPPLRAAALSGAQLNLFAPICRMRRADDADPSYDDRMTRQQSITLSFVEAL